MSELLDSPANFLHYLSQRTRKSKFIIANNEHEVIGAYLHGGLAFNGRYDLVRVEPEMANYVDMAMEIRRNNGESFSIPEDLMDELQGTYLGGILSVLQQEPSTVAIDLGLLLLGLVQYKVPIRELNLKIEKIMDMISQGHDHGFSSLTLSHISTGITFMCVPDPTESYAQKLWAICNIRKYEHEQERWFGILLLPSGDLISVCVLNQA